MKTRISMYFALAAMLCAPTACAQYAQQPGQQPGQQPIAPVISPQQSWANAAYRNTIQQPIAQNAAYGNTANTANGSVGCDSYCGGNNGCCGGGGGCDSRGCGGFGGGCGSGCDSGGRGGFGGGCGGGGFGGGCGGGGCGGGCGGGGFGGGCGSGCGGGGMCGFKYDPCCPMKYFSVYGGASYFQTLNTDIGFAVAGGPAGNGSIDLAYNDGWGVGGAIGRSVGKRFRVELDFTYRNSSVDNVAAFLGGQNLGGNLPLDGKMNIYSFIPNLVMDLNPNGRFNPYVGIGAGVAFSELDANVDAIPVFTNFKGSDFAYQGIFGFSFAVKPTAEFFFEYRYFATDRTSFDLASPFVSASADVDQSSNDYFVGLRVKKW